MKALILAIFLIFVSGTASAVTEDQLPVACDSSKKIFDALKTKKFSPVLLGEVDNTQTTIWINPDMDMVIAITVQSQGKFMTCIFVGGEKNTQIIEPPKNKPDSRF